VVVGFPLPDGLAETGLRLKFKSYPSSSLPEPKDASHGTLRLD
jgi:hypothetical protein